MRRAYLIQYVEIAGDPTRSEVWKQLDEFVMRQVASRTGRQSES